MMQVLGQLARALRHRPMRALICVVAVAIAGAGCSSSGAGAPSTSSTAPSASTPSTAKPVVAKSVRAKRYCEVLLVHLGPGGANADVYNSYPLNTCPAAKWTKLDAKAIAAKAGVPVAVLNGPRYWLMDTIEKSVSPDRVRADFGGIEMIREASVAIGSLAVARQPYTLHAVDRSTVFTFDAGRTVYELTTPAHVTYVMQSWSQQVDPKLTEADLAGLGARLHLPAGWTYRARTLTSPLRVVTTKTDARVLQDDLENSYSLETP